MPTGFGTMPMGLAPAGFGGGDPAPVPPTGQWGSRFIDPRTGDFANDVETGQLQQMPPVRQRFLLKLTTRLGSSTVRPLDGIQLPAKINESTERQVDDAVRVTMHQETDVEKVARIDSVKIQRDPSNTGRVAIVVSYTDLTTGLTDGVTL